VQIFGKGYDIEQADHHFQLAMKHKTTRGRGRIVAKAGRMGPTNRPKAIKNKLLDTRYEFWQDRGFDLSTLVSPTPLAELGFFDRRQMQVVVDEKSRTSKKGRLLHWPEACTNCKKAGRACEGFSWNMTCRPCSNGGCDIGAVSRRA
jgi:hypothetical protein